MSKVDPTQAQNLVEKFTELDILARNTFGEVVINEETEETMANVPQCILGEFVTAHTALRDGEVEDHLEFVVDTIGILTRYAGKYPTATAREIRLAGRRHLKV